MTQISQFTPQNRVSKTGKELNLMGWLYGMNWIDIVLLIAFVLVFWAMVLALVTSLFGGHRHLREPLSPTNGVVSSGISFASHVGTATSRNPDHDER